MYNSITLICNNIYGCGNPRANLSHQYVFYSYVDSIAFRNIASHETDSVPNLNLLLFSFFNILSCKKGNIKLKQAHNTPIESHLRHFHEFWFIPCNRMIAMVTKTHARSIRLANSLNVNMPPHSRGIFLYNDSALWNNIKYLWFSRLYHDICCHTIIVGIT